MKLRLLPTVIVLGVAIAAIATGATAFLVETGNGFSFNKFEGRTVETADIAGAQQAIEGKIPLGSSVDAIFLWSRECKVQS
jgi:hypothetical protein